MSSLALVYAADAICFFRILASITVVIIGRHPIAPYLFAAALISDLFDGWFFRHYTEGNANWRPWNPLPFSLDPLADLTLTLCGVAYVGRHLFLASWSQIFVCMLVFTIFVGAISIIPQIAPLKYAHLAYIIVNTFKTHACCLLMVASSVAIWYINTPDNNLGAVVTVGLFYFIFGAIGDKKRLIRRPPSDWRTA